MSIKTSLKRAFKGTWIEKLYKFLQRATATKEEMIAYREHDAMNQFFAKILKTDSNVIDIGCHMGEMLAQFCQLAPKGHHIAFEPIPSQAAWLREKFPQAKIMQMAVADKEGELEFFHNIERPAFSGLSVQRPEDKTEVLKVKVSSLDIILDAHAPLALVKIDVEGAELPVFQGARETIKKWRPAILFEFVDHASARHGAPADVFFDALSQEFKLEIFLIESWLNGKPALSKQDFISHCKNYTAYNFVAFVK